MKNAMKKLFSLMLVAVLLVSALPFQALAAETTLEFALEGLEAGKEYSVDEIAAELYSGSSTNYWVHRWTPYQEDYTEGTFTAVEDGTYTLYVVETTPDPQPEPVDPCAEGHDWNAGEVTTAPTCTTEGVKTFTCSRNAEHTKTEPVAALDHDWNAGVVTTAATCTTEGVKTFTCSRNAEHTKTEVIPTADHTYGTDGKCTVCKTACNICDKDVCTCGQVVVEFKSNVGTREYESIVAKPGETISLPTAQWVSGYEFIGWRLNGSTENLGTTYKIPANATGTITIVAKYETTYTTPTYPLKVYARLYTGDELIDVVPFHENLEMLSTDKIMEYLSHADTKALLENKINAKYPDYTWSGNFYNAYGERVATDNITTVDGAKSVYINLYCEADQVLIYVHTQSKTEKYDRLFEMDGYKVGGPAIRLSEVRSFLKDKYGSGITIKMFDEKGFKDYLNGKENTNTDYIEVTGNPTKVHVRLYTSSGSSSSGTADTTNPKTGDMIFAPVAILGLSATALAVLFFLNKKRAV